MRDFDEYVEIAVECITCGLGLPEYLKRLDDGDGVPDARRVVKAWKAAVELMGIGF